MPWVNPDHPHVGNPQPYCMCIDCRGWRQSHMRWTGDVPTPVSETAHTSDRENRQDYLRIFNMARHGGRLDGTGFIVLNAREHPTTEEFDTLDAATEEAQIMAGGALQGGQGSGMAIVYAPVAIVRPNVPANVRVSPSALMDQVNAARGGVGRAFPSMVSDVAHADAATPDAATPGPVSNDPNDKNTT